MAQKSLPSINKVGTSMIWYSTFYTAYYKWFSSQSLYFLYFFNKLTVYLDLFYLRLFWIPFERTSWHYGEKISSVFRKNELRFYKPVTSYLIGTKEANLIFNLYYKTNLERFQNMSSDKFKFANIFGVTERNFKIIQKMFFTKSLTK